VSGILLAILALGFLIVVHEAGHYFVARWCKMRVERFSVGFGPGILKRRAKSGTVFQLAPIPFGGFVEIRGMNIAEEVDPEDIHAYPNRPAWQRFITILAGPATNYISAIFIVFGLYMCTGMKGSTYHIAEVSDGYDAKGKLLPGDRIVAIDGHEMFGPSSTEIGKAINLKAGKPVEITVQRHYALVTLMVTPKVGVDEKGKEILDKDNKPQFKIGIIPTPDRVDVGVGEALVGSLRYPITQTQAIFGGFKDIFTGKEEADPGGPVRIVKEFETAFSRGLGDGFALLAMLSVYLGLFNLLPLPALDGGRLVFLAYEMVTRRRANPKIETMVHMGGIMVLMIVMILVTLHDFNVI
jgi:regulator of sigma E protease